MLEMVVIRACNVYDRPLSDGGRLLAGMSQLTNAFVYV